jgi:hypothetical protein
VVNTTAEICILIALLCIILIIFLILQVPLFQRESFTAALAFLLITSLAAAVFITTHISSPSRPGDSAVPIFILVFAINTMMPLPRWAAAVISTFIAVVHLLLVAFSNDYSQSHVIQVSDKYYTLLSMFYLVFTH